MGWTVHEDREYDYDRDGSYNNTDRFRLPKDRNDTVYGYSQNTHDKNVRRSVATSVKNLLKDDLHVTMQDIRDSDLSYTAIERAEKYCKSTHLHGLTGITYKTLLLHVWQRVVESEYRAELTSILSEHLEYSKRTCFTGRFNLILSTLAGFCDDINIDISESAHIGGIIVAARESLKTYNDKKHHDIARERLVAAGYDEETIKPWLKAIWCEED